MASKSFDAKCAIRFNIAWPRETSPMDSKGFFQLPAVQAKREVSTAADEFSGCNKRFHLLPLDQQMPLRLVNAKAISGELRSGIWTAFLVSGRQSRRRERRRTAGISGALHRARGFSSRGVLAPLGPGLPSDPGVAEEIRVSRRRRTLFVLGTKPPASLGQASSFWRRRRRPQAFSERNGIS